MIIVTWTCAILIELRRVTTLGMIVYAIPSGTHGPQVSQVTDGATRINFMNLTSRLLGFGIVALETGVCIFLGYVGIMFLQVTTTKVDLILNALALTFVLELGQILFQAIVPRIGQELIQNLEPVKYFSILPNWYLPLHRYFFPILMIIIFTAFAFCMRLVQLHEFRELFNVTATLCLFGGPTKSTATHFAPVPGMCESLLALTCAPPSEASLLQDFGSCVITDFDAGWAKNIKKPSSESIWPHDIFKNYSPTSSPWEWALSDDPRVKEKFDTVVRSVWNPQSTQVLMRACAAMYQAGPTIKLVVDPNTNEEGFAASFSCDKQASNLLGTVLQNLDYEGGWRVNVSHLNLLDFEENFGKALSRCR